MKTVSIHKAKTNLSKYIESAKKGQPIFIGSRGKVEVKLVAATEQDLVKPKRKLGQGSGEYWMAEDFDETDDLTKQMLDGNI
jgi:prevent-host-death family protein